MAHSNLSYGYLPRLQLTESFIRRRQSGGMHNTNSQTKKNSRFQISNTNSRRHPHGATLSPSPHSALPDHLTIMPRTLKSKRSQRWTMPSFFSSGFSDRPTAITTATKTPSMPTTTGTTTTATTTPIITTERKEKRSDSEGEMTRALTTRRLTFQRARERQSIEYCRAPSSLHHPTIARAQ